MKLKRLLIVLLIIFITIPANITKAETSEELDLHSQAAVLIDSATGKILYDKNAKEKMYPASTTKILTSIIIIENCNLDDKVLVNRSSLLPIPSGYTTCNLQPDEEISVKDLLTAFLVVSANEAGYVLAEYYAGSISNFAELMNKKAEEIGCENSHFVNPSGIHNEDHYSTAYDLSLIARYCMQNETFRKIVSIQSCTIAATNKSDVRKLTNTNDLINPSSKYYIEDCIGIKTGFTTAAQNCLISGFSKNGLELISVVLGASSTGSGESIRYTDTKALYKYGYSNYSLKTIIKQNDVIQNIEIPNGSKETKNLNLVAEKDFVSLVKLGKEIENPTITINENLSAPIMKNDTVGTITYVIDGIEYSQNLVAQNNVEKNNIILHILLIILVIFLLLIFILFSLKNKAKRTKKTRSKYNRNY